MVCGRETVVDIVQDMDAEEETQPQSAAPQVQIVDGKIVINESTVTHYSESSRDGTASLLDSDAPELQSDDIFCWFPCARAYVCIMRACVLRTYVCVYVCMYARLCWG